LQKKPENKNSKTWYNNIKLWGKMAWRVRRVEGRRGHAAPGEGG